MRWVSLAGTSIIALWSIWLLLLAYRVVGKHRGQDPKYDASIEYWSGTIKIVGILGIIVFILEVLNLVVEHR